MKILVTGTAGFIGYHLAKKLLERGDEVVGIDNINDYYNVNLKYGRLKELGIDREEVEAVMNLVAQAGVRYSLENPHAYIQSNVVGFLNILEGCRNYGVKNLAYASSSSVYGLNESQPFKTRRDLPNVA